MRILVVSDSHGRTKAVSAAQAAAGKVDACIHLGDCAADAQAFCGSADIYAVRGNCDISGFSQTELLVETEGKMLFLTHGHKYGVKQGVDRLFYRAQEAGAHVVLFGHTHIPFEAVEQGILLLNPGTLMGDGAKRQTYAVLTINDSGINSRLFTLDK